MKVDVSDPTRTIVDLLSDPALGGGIRPVSDMFLSYMKSKHKDTKLLVEYGKRLGNRALFKRLGFLAERFAPKKSELIDECMINLSKGNAKFDPKLVCKRLVKKWRLWIPASWREEK